MLIKKYNTRNIKIGMKKIRGEKIYLNEKN